MKFVKHFKNAMRSELKVCGTSRINDKFEDHREHNNEKRFKEQ